MKVSVKKMPPKITTPRLVKPTAPITTMRRWATFLALSLIGCCLLIQAGNASDTLVVSSTDTVASSKELSAELSVTMLSSPAGPFSGEPNFAVSPAGQIVLSWVEKSSDTLSSLLISHFANNTWSVPQTVASGSDWFVNWADFPTVAMDKDKNILASWLVKSAPETFAYDVHLALSSDIGESWTNSFVLHSDKTQTEHGFVSTEPLHDGGFAVTWLDGRQTAEEGGAMSLRFATVSSAGVIENEALLDNRVCDCCQTAMTILSDGTTLVGYRDRSDNEIRDTYIVRSQGDSWSAPIRISDDNWKIAGCPVNGPALASSDSLVVVSWFTMGSDEKPKVYCAFSRDFGKTFQAPLRLDGGNPLGRVDVVMYDSQTALVSWLEQIGESAEIIVRLAQPDGSLSKSRTVTESSTSRASGFARMAPMKDGVLVSWTNDTDTSSVGAALIKVKK
jgi:hypothetical protein